MTVWKDGKRSTYKNLKESQMLELTLGMTVTAVQVFDETFDAFNQNEVAFTHAALRAVTNYMESREDDQKNEITDMLLDQQQEQESDTTDTLFERKIIVDDATNSWLERIAKKKGADAPESVFMMGVFLLAVMLEILKRNPTATLRPFPLVMPIRQIVDGKPQFHH